MKEPSESRPPEAKPKKGQFVKGQSGNPGGQRKEAKEMRELFLGDVGRAREKLLELMEEGNMFAIRTVLEYGLGKPIQGVELTGKDGERLQVSLNIHRTVRK